MKNKSASREAIKKRVEEIEKKYEGDEEESEKVMSEKRCEHGVVTSSCCVCHPEIAEHVQRTFQYLVTSPEMDAAYEGYIMRKPGKLKRKG